MCNSSTTTSATEVMTETQYVKRLVSQGTSTNPPPLPAKTPEKEKKIPTKRGLDMLLQEIDRNAAKFVPEPEAQKKERKNPLPWESGMVSMMQDLKGSINRDSEHYKSLKDGLLTCHKDFLTDYKKQFCDGESDETSSNSSDDSDNNLKLPLPNAEDLTSADKIKEWFEQRQENSEIKKPSKSFLFGKMGVYKPCDGQTEDEMEAEIHKKDTEQILKNSHAFYEKFLKFAENDFIAKSESDSEEVIEEEEDLDEELLTESKENAEREEARRLDAELDNATVMFRDYLKGCENSAQAVDEIDKAFKDFIGVKGISNVTYLIYASPVLKDL